MDLATHISIDRQCKFAIAELDALLMSWKAKHADLLRPLTYGGGGGEDDLPALVSVHYDGKEYQYISQLSSLMHLDPWPESYE